MSFLWLTPEFAISVYNSDLDKPFGLKLVHSKEQAELVLIHAQMNKVMIYIN